MAGVYGLSSWLRRGAEYEVALTHSPEEEPMDMYWGQFSTVSHPICVAGL